MSYTISCENYPGIHAQYDGPIFDTPEEAEAECRMLAQEIAGASLADFVVVEWRDSHNTAGMGTCP